MRSNQEVGENSPGARVAMFSAALRVSLESSTGSSPYRFIQMPIDGYSRVFKKRGNESFGAPRGGDQLSEHRRGHRKISAMERGVKSGASGQSDPSVRVPQGDNDVRVDRGGHDQSLWPRISRSHRLMAFLPDGIPGLPIPRYFSNTLWLRTGRTCTPLLSLSNRSRSPGRTPKIRRTSTGTVICPLLVILDSFCMAIFNSLLYHIVLTLNTAQNKRGRDCSLPHLYSLKYRLNYTRP